MYTANWDSKILTVESHDVLASFVEQKSFHMAMGTNRGIR